MSKPIERQMTCWHCGGLRSMPSGGACLDCHGAGTLCTICGMPPSLCHCPDAAFRGEFERPVVLPGDGLSPPGRTETP